MTKNESINVFSDLVHKRVTTWYRGKRYPLVKIDKAKKLHGYRIPIETGVTLTFVEQNPNKDSAPARRAKKGAKIVWVIPSNEKPWYRIEDGKLYLGNSTVPI